MAFNASELNDVWREEFLAPEDESLVSSLEGAGVKFAWTNDPAGRVCFRAVDASGTALAETTMWPGAPAGVVVGIVLREVAVREVARETYGFLERFA